jgi:Domain of unknown function (DUF5668)
MSEAPKSEEPGAPPVPKPWQIPTGGVVLIVIGGIFLYGMTLGDAGSGMRILWPVILIAIGLTQLINARFREGGGFVLLVLGSAFLLFTHDVLPWASIGQWWPLAIILAGLGMMWGRGRRRK